MNLIVSLDNNILKLSIETKEGFKAVRGEVSKDAVNDSVVTNSDAFLSTFDELLSQFPNVKKKKLEAVFLIEPSDAIFKFVVVSKNEGADVDEQVLNEMKQKLEGTNLDDLYFSYQKIAPFVYQFVGVKKEILDGYIELSQKLQISLKAVVPWVLLLPKFLDSNDPCVFILNTEDRQTIALAELNGIYYSEDYEGNKSAKEIQELIQKLSVYKRSSPINKVYSLARDDLNLGKGFTVSPIMELPEDSQEAEGYEIQLLAKEVLDSNPEYLSTQVNLLNLLPVPVKENKRPVAVYVGVGGAVVVFIGIGLVYGFFVRERDVNDAQPPLDNNEVLSNQNTDGESESENSSVSEEPNLEDLNKSDITIRVENGAGIQGIAANTQDFLEKKEYIVQSVGNSDEDGRTNTLVKIKTSKSAFKDLLVEDLKDEYELIVEDGLDEELEYDVLIVVGTN